jgi:membrane protein DedA with SNARE-associated domain
MPATLLGMERAKPTRARLWLVLGPLMVLVVAAQIGDAFAPTLATEHPLLLITLNARNRNLILTTNSLDALWYYGVGFVRLLISDPLFYIIGYWYGDAAVAWVEKRSSSFGGMLRTWERGFKKAAWPLVAIAPNNFICLFAGAAGMAPAIFITLNVVGTIFRLWLIRIFGKAFESPIDDLLGWIQEYRWPLTAITAALVVVTLVTDRRAGKGEIEALTHIEDELGTEEHPPEHPVGPPEVPIDADDGDAPA